MEHVTVRASDGPVLVPSDTFASFLALSQFDASPDDEVPAPNVSSVDLGRLISLAAGDDAGRMHALNGMELRDVVRLQLAADYLNSQWALSACTMNIASRLDRHPLSEVHALLGVPQPQPLVWHFE